MIEDNKEDDEEESKWGLDENAGETNIREKTKNKEEEKTEKKSNEKYENYVALVDEVKINRCLNITSEREVTLMMSEKQALFVVWGNAPL